MNSAIVERILRNNVVIVRTEDNVQRPVTNPLLKEIHVGAEIYINDNREIVKKVTYKSDIWRRATDEETQQIVDTLEQQPVSLRMLFKDVLYLDHFDEQFEMVESILVDLFGQERTDGLLEPSISNE